MSASTAEAFADAFVFSRNGSGGGHGLQAYACSRLLVSSAGPEGGGTFADYLRRYAMWSRKSAWLEELQEKLAELCALPEGWDSYDGRAVLPGIALFAREILDRVYEDGLPMPSLVPGSDGSLQIEWHCMDYDIEVDILAPYDVECCRGDIRTDGEDDELRLTADFTELHAWIRSLVGRAKTQSLALGAADIGIAGFRGTEIDEHSDPHRYALRVVRTSGSEMLPDVGDDARAA